MPFFSIIVPSYNRAHFLQRTIDSVLCQSFANWELLIIDDASTDNSKEIVDSIKDERIKYFRNNVNIERSASRNKGIDLSHGKYICFLDSDDAYRPHHLQTFYDFITKENQPIGLLYTGIQINFIEGDHKTKFECPNNKENIIEWLLKNQFPPPSCTCISKEILNQQTFNSRFKINEDIELWVRIAVSYPIYSIDCVTVDFYIHGGNTKLVNHNTNIEELQVVKSIFANPLCKNKISKRFKKTRLQTLRSQIIASEIANNAKNAKNISLPILFFLVRYPFAYKNKQRLYVLLINIPILRFGIGLYSKLKRM
jgi:glycosyltransferase involved in cell wall biosynthesis